MDELECVCRKNLRRLRSAATSIGHLYRGYEFMFARWPETQAYTIIEGEAYGFAAILLIHKILSANQGQMKFEDLKYLNLTGILEDLRHLNFNDEKTIEKLRQFCRKKLKEEYDPLDVYKQLTMPLLKEQLEEQEITMVEAGYRLPRWDAPRWLREMSEKEEGKCYRR